MTTIVAPKVSETLAQIVDPDATIWSSAQTETIDMAPTPIGYQPSVYVVAAWRERPYGAVPRVEVRALHTGKELAFRIEWDEPSPTSAPDDTDKFADGAGVLFPQNGVDAVIESMGTPEKPVNAWYWRPNLTQPIHALGQGAGSVVRLTDGAVAGKGKWAGGRWRVVLARALDAGQGVRISAPGSVNASFAVWRGANQERAGIKSFGQTWHEIRLEG